MNDSELDIIVRAVAQIFGYTSGQLLGTKRSKRLANARHHAIAIAEQMTSYSHAEIASHFDRTHGSVNYAIGVVRGTGSYNHVAEAVSSTLKRNREARLL